ncbi:hypothetical protein BDFG_05191 [Blastomyces dermatitidis ATCC 26199]|nr:hypothetical protein BDFG_05191 [Blastomyces dermatitidis ATCC 26199]
MDRRYPTRSTRTHNTPEQEPLEPQSPPQTAQKVRTEMNTGHGTSSRGGEDLPSTGHSTPTQDSPADEVAEMLACFTHLQEAGFPEADAAKIAREQWLQKQGINPNPTTAANPVTGTGKFREFKDDYSHVEMKITTKLSGPKDYDIWRREIESKAVLIDASHILISSISLRLVNLYTVFTQHEFEILYVMSPGTAEISPRNLFFTAYVG